MKTAFTEIFTTYWSQTTLLLLGVGYIIKRILDNRSNKTSVNHTIYQEHRIKSVNEFLVFYSKSENLFHKIAIYEILSGKMPTKEIDEAIFPTLNELEKSLLVLRIYFDDKDYSIFEQLVKNIFAINQRLKHLVFDFDPLAKLSEKVNDFEWIKMEKININKEIIKGLSQIIRKTYKS